jgi:hypothetical protein
VILTSLHSSLGFKMNLKYLGVGVVAWCILTKPPPLKPRQGSFVYTLKKEPPVKQPVKGGFLSLVRYYPIKEEFLQMQDRLEKQNPYLRKSPRQILEEIQGFKKD